MENKIKIIVVGDSTVGKTAVIYRYVDNVSPNTVPTVGVDFKSKKMNIRGEDVKVMIWDTAGQERFRGLTNSYFRKAQGIALFFDVTNPDSFSHLQNWLDSISENIDQDSSCIPIVVLGNKIDLVDDRKVFQDEVQKFLAGSYPYFETSAKTGEGVQEAFTQLVEQILDKNRFKPVSNQYEGVPINDNAGDASHKKKCCK